ARKENAARLRDVDQLIRNVVWIWAAGVPATGFNRFLLRLAVIAGCVSRWFIAMAFGLTPRRAEIDVIGHDLCDISLLTVLVLVGSGLKTTCHENTAPLR